MVSTTPLRPWHCCPIPVHLIASYLRLYNVKTKHNGVNSFANAIDSARTKEFFLGLQSSSLNSLKLKASWSSVGTEVGQKKRHQVTVGASPPTEDAVISTEPLTKQDLVDYLASGCNPKEKWKLNF